jgi:MFS transporter, PAT family, beta-lactamase induction signal transducer AmpG
VLVLTHLQNLRRAGDKVGLLFALYLAQGLPFGYQANALPLFLTEAGASLEKVSLSRALALPWLLKALWAPLIDRFGSDAFGRKKSWIVPLQIALAIICLMVPFLQGRFGLNGLMLAVLLLNLGAAMQDVAVDGLAVILLKKQELGLGNSAQVVGYKVGMLLGGSLLLAWFSADTLFSAMALLFALVAFAALRFVEPRNMTMSNSVEALSFRVLGEHLLRIARAPSTRWVVALVVSYKVGESMVDAMFGPFLVRVHQLPKESVATWIGGFGLVGSVLGSLLGGLLATRFERTRALLLASVLRLVPLVLPVAMASGLLAVTRDTVVIATVAEHFFGGMLTTTMFAFMMERVDAVIGSTHYTLLASVEVLGKSPSALLSGLAVTHYGFTAVFAFGVVLSACFSLLVWVARNRVVVDFKPTST